MSNKRALFWFRDDLRVEDNPALFRAASEGHVLLLYIHAQNSDCETALDMAQKQAVFNLNKSLDGNLLEAVGCPKEIIPKVCLRYNLEKIFVTRVFQTTDFEQELVDHLAELGIGYQAENGSLLWEPETCLKKDGTPYKVFTPFYRAAYQDAPIPRQPLSRPVLSVIPPIDSSYCQSKNKHPAWAETLLTGYDFSEQGALQQLDRFIREGLQGYQLHRDYPAERQTSQLSPYLRLGLLSPNQIWYRAHGVMGDENAYEFCRQLGWREFAYHVLYHWPVLKQENYQKKFDRYPWLSTRDHFEAWKHGKTGVPIVDAGMRELWHTGFMHNRVRMIVGSFLTKNLSIDWRMGRNWFDECLLDADEANNTFGWQWVAGCGLDAAPFFRVFNPYLQSRKFDANGIYLRKWVPELTALNNKDIHCPQLVNLQELKRANIKIGKDYPYPIVDVKLSAKNALEHYKSI